MLSSMAFPLIRPSPFVDGIEKPGELVSKDHLVGLIGYDDEDAAPIPLDPVMAGSVASQVVTDLMNGRIPQALMQEEFHKIVLCKPDRSSLAQGEAFCPWALNCFR